MSESIILSSYPGHKEIVISDEKELRNLLTARLDQQHSTIMLFTSDVGTLTLGIGEPFGFVEFMNNAGLPPYLIAIEPRESEDPNNSVEFDAGGTPTPIPIDKCLPFARVVEIAVDFYKNKELPRYINWIEI